MMVRVPSYRGVCMGAILILIAVITCARFIGLESSPPGFYIDEAINGSEAICLGQTGHDVNGVARPFFSDCAGGGLCSPTHLYSSTVWVFLFGDSIGALRAMAAFFMSLAIIGLFFFARVFIGSRGALYVALSACLSPWLFQFARMAVDSPSTMLFGLTWGMYFFIRSQKRRDGIFAALFFALAMYSYPPARALVPIVFLLLLILKARFRGFSWNFLSVFITAVLIFSAPLIWLTLRGGILRRYGLVGILSPSYIATLTHQSWLDVIWVFFANVCKHLNLDYLFVAGDMNLRHSTRFAGELSWLDGAALFLGLIFWIYASVKMRRPVFDDLYLFAILGFLAGIIPAALTWESLPHSLRSLGSWPFASLLTGVIIFRVEQFWPRALLFFTSIAVVFVFLFGHYYFEVYPEVAPAWFDASVKDAAIDAKASGDWVHFVLNLKQYDSRATRYYLMRYGGKSCEESLSFVRQLGIQ